MKQFIGILGLILFITGIWYTGWSEDISHLVMALGVILCGLSCVSVTQDFLILKRGFFRFMGVLLVIGGIFYTIMELSDFVYKNL